MNLRVSLNVERISGAHGGASKFATNLQTHLEGQGHDVFRELVPDLDCILIISSDPDLSLASYGHVDIEEYVQLNPETVVVQRVNGCDEQRGNDLGYNDHVLAANEVTDRAVFVSEFMKRLFERKGMVTDETDTVIHNAADREIYNPDGRAAWETDEKLRCVTHHWSTNFMKGFDVYERFDTLLNYEPYSEMFEFTYVGRKPTGVEFENANYVEPLSGQELADELKNHHFYVTGARHEAGPNHVSEGLQCGLPMLYLDTGALPEYSEPFGIEFDLTNFEENLLRMYEQYPTLREQMLDCDYSATRTMTEYESVFLDAAGSKDSQQHPLTTKLLEAKIRLFDRPKRKVERVAHLGKIGWRYLQ